VLLAIAVAAACGSDPAGSAPAADGAPPARGDDARPAGDDVVDCAAVAAAIDLDGQVAANQGAWRGRYPLVLAHGFFGFDQVGPLEYFVGVADALRGDGFAVYVTAVEPIAGTDATRGPTLGREVECIARAAGAARVNLVGHSQGGLDVRWVASDPVRARRVASVTTIATPHHGTPVADVTLGLLPGATDDLVDALASLWGQIVAAPDDSADLRAAMQGMAVADMDAWNAAHPDAAGVDYFSWAGRSVSDLVDPDLGAAACAGAVHANPAGRDPIDPLLATTFAYLRQVAGPNDGLVDVASARWGAFLGCIAADHFDQVGLFSLSRPDSVSGFDHLDFFVDLAEELEARGD